MIERETEIHHVTYCDCVIFDYHRSLHYCIHTKNTSVRLVDNWH